MPVKPLIEFRGLPPGTDLNLVKIPEARQNRQCTDVHFILVFLIMVIILMPFLVIGLIYGNASRIFGHDQCGNVCGQKNVKDAKWACSGKDFTKFPYLQMDVSIFESEVMSRDEFLKTPRKCVEKCEDGYFQKFSYCYKQDTRKVYEMMTMFDVINGINLHKQHYIRVIVAFVLCPCICVAALFIFVKFPKFFFGLSVVAILIEFIFAILILWIFLKEVSSISLTKAEKYFVIFGIVFFIIVFVVILILLVIFYRKVKLVILLLYEAIEAVWSMPLLIAVSLIIFLIECILIAVGGYTSVIISTSGNLKQISYDTETQSAFLSYDMGPLVIFTIIFNLCIYIWAIMFFIDLHYIITAGAVARWYWTPSARPIFFKSGKRAAMIVFYNLINILAIKFISGFIILVVEVFACFLCLLVCSWVFLGTELQLSMYNMYYMAVVSITATIMLFGLFSTAIDTIFICYCEDTLINDGQTRPYVMSPGLAGFMNKSYPIWKKTPPPN